MGMLGVHWCVLWRINKHVEAHTAALFFGARKANIPMPSFKSYGRALVPIALVLRPLAACKKASKEWYAGLISAA